MTLGQVAFEAYKSTTGGIAFNGKPIPEWPFLTDKVREAWEAAAKAVLNQK